jgi:hypothetical protein
MKNVKPALKTHLLHTKNQNIGVRKIQDKYLNLPEINISLIVILVDINLKVPYTKLLE